jgi:hypothetical protein
VNLAAGDSFSLSGEFYRIAIESDAAKAMESRGSLQKLATTLVNSADSGALKPDSSSSSSSSGPGGSSNSFEPQKTEVVIREKRTPKSAKSDSGATPSPAEAEERPLAKSASTKHESIILEYESDSEEGGGEKRSPAKSKGDGSPSKQASPAKSSKKRKEREEPEESAAGDVEGEKEEIAPRRSKRQRVELFNMDSILDEREEDVADEDEFGSASKKTRGKRSKGNKQEEKLEEILAGFSAANFSSDAKLALLYHEECMNHVTPGMLLETTIQIFVPRRLFLSLRSRLPLQLTRISFLILQMIIWNSPDG